MKKFKGLYSLRRARRDHMKKGKLDIFLLDELASLRLASNSIELQRKQYSRAGDKFEDSLYHKTY